MQPSSGLDNFLDVGLFFSCDSYISNAEREAEPPFPFEIYLHRYCICVSLYVTYLPYVGI